MFISHYTNDTTATLCTQGLDFVNATGVVRYSKANFHHLCSCVTSQIAKSFLFDRRSDLLSFRLVARPPPTQDPAHLLNYLPRILTAPYDQQNMAFTVQPRFLLVDPTGSSIVLSASQRPFPDLGTVHICWLDEPCFFHHNFFFCILQSRLPGSQRKFVALPICLKPPHMNPFQPVSNWWGMNTEVIPVALLSWDICNHLPNIMRGLGPSTFSSPNSHCQDQILHLLKHKRETVRERDETEFQEADSLCSSSMVHKPSK